MDEVNTPVANFDKQNYIMCACSDSNAGEDDTHKSAGGVVHCHAYSVIRVEDDVAGSGFDLLQLRNPWGRTEWNGDWSDHSDKWDDNPEVRDALQPEAGDDGTFW